MALPKRLFAFVLSSLKAFLSLFSSLSLMMAGGHVHAATAASTSPLLAQSQAAQASIARIAAAIGAAGDGTINAANIRAAIAEAAAANPGITPDMMAAAINQCGFDPGTLAEALKAQAETFDIPLESAVAALVTDSYMTHGRDAALAQKEQLREIFGDTLIDTAFAGLPLNDFQTLDELRNIQPASGVYDG